MSGKNIGIHHISTFAFHHPSSISYSFLWYVFSHIIRKSIIIYEYSTPWSADGQSRNRLFLPPTKFRFYQRQQPNPALCCNEFQKISFKQSKPNPSIKEQSLAAFITGRIKAELEKLNVSILNCLKTNFTSDLLTLPIALLLWNGKSAKPETNWKHQSHKHKNHLSLIIVFNDSTNHNIQDKRICLILMLSKHVS